MQHRAQDVLYSCSWLMGDENNDDGNNEDKEHQNIVLGWIRPSLDKQNVMAACFSYGAATVSSVASLQPNRFQCAVLLDPWLHIDYSSK